MLQSGLGRSFRRAPSAQCLATSAHEAEDRRNDPEQLKQDFNYCVNLVRERDREGFCKSLLFVVVVVVVV